LTVNNNILLSKLELYGLVGVFKALITSYLCDRYQRVVLDNKNLIIVLLRIGRSLSMEFPRAQFLVHCFFLLYIADDTNVIIPNSSLQELETVMNNQFVAINEWFKDNLLSLN
jgi:hypothetical protein